LPVFVGHPPSARNGEIVHIERVDPWEGDAAQRIGEAGIASFLRCSRCAPTPFSRSLPYQAGAALGTQEYVQ